MAAPDGPPNGRIVVTPLTRAASKPPVGYFQDPYAITLRGPLAGTPGQFFSGTTPALLACPASIDANCEEVAPVRFDPGTLGAEAEALGSRLGVSDNYNVFIAPNGAWHMIVTIYVNRADAPAGSTGWTVIVHAHPQYRDVSSPWLADALLAGSFTKPAKGNYDGKIFADADGTLYLIYSRNLSPNPVRDGLVAQRMVSPSKLSVDAPVTLLRPEPGAGLVSEIWKENAPDDQFRLVETGNITRINGKYALAYSTGDFEQSDYKAGVAWSDTLLPKPGQFYRKVLRPDMKGVWGTPGGEEVQYLLQSQQLAWPNDIADQVIAPGVPSIAQQPDGSWRLYFAGFDPSNAPHPTGEPLTFESKYRRPYEAGLRVVIPAGISVARATDAELATWLTLER